MPGVNDYNGMWLESAIGQALATLRMIQTQQQMTLSNLQGQPIMNFGLIPGSNPPAFGQQFLNPSTTGQILFIGEDGAGNTYLAFYNASGTKVSQWDQTGLTQFNASGVKASTWDVNGLHFYDTSGNEVTRLDSIGLHSYNTSGTEEVRAGNLGAGEYGLEVLNSAGVMQMVAGVVAAGPSSTSSTTSTTPVAISGTTVTTNVGPSGQALVTVCGEFEMNGPSSGGGYCYFGVGVDGSAPALDWGDIQTNLSNTQLTVSVSATRVVTGLSQGSHTFQAYFWKDSAASSAAQTKAYVIVVPQ